MKTAGCLSMSWQPISASNRTPVYTWIHKKGLPAHRMGRLWKMKRSNELWAHGVDVAETYVDTVARKSPYAQFTPYELYLKFLYEGRGYSSISEPTLRGTISDPDRLCKVSVPASKGWKPGLRSRPSIGRTDPRAPRGGTTTPAGRPPALRAVMRPAPTRTRRANI